MTGAATGSIGARDNPHRDGGSHWLHGEIRGAAQFQNGSQAQNAKLLFDQSLIGMLELKHRFDAHRVELSLEVAANTPDFPHVEAG